jgi:hypothetical protein
MNNIQNLFTINVLYEFIVQFLDIEGVKLRTICNKWKNIPVVCKSLNLIIGTNIDSFIDKLPSIIYTKYLEQIQIYGHKVNEMCAVNLQTLSQFKNLKEIHLFDIFYISDKSMYFLHDLHKLESLIFTRCYITDTAHEYIRNDNNTRVEDNEEFNICKKCEKHLEETISIKVYLDDDEIDNDLKMISSLLCQECYEIIERCIHRYTGYGLSKRNCHIIEDNTSYILKEFNLRNKLEPDTIPKSCKAFCTEIIYVVGLTLFLPSYFLGTKIIYLYHKIMDNF